MSHLAFDLGLTTTGAWWGESGDAYTLPAAYRRSPLTPERKHERFMWWFSTFCTIVRDHPGTVVAEEAFMSRKHPKGAMPLIEIHGALRAAAALEGRMVHTIVNGTIKKWATGRGNANKDDMMAAARDLGWSGTDHNEADAFLLWQMWGRS